VFATVGDPVGGGFVESLARPGGNITGFVIFEYAIGAKWLELLREISPSTTRVAVLRDPAVATGPGQFGAIQTAAPSCRMEVSPVNVRDASEIGRAATAFAQTPNGGLIVTGTPLAQLHRDLIISLAAKHRLASIPTRRRVRRQDPTRSEAREYPDRATDQIRTGHQSWHRKGARHRNPAAAACPCRRSDRIEVMSLLAPSGHSERDQCRLLGVKRTFCV
jgi:hypothetical protein